MRKYRIIYIIALITDIMIFVATNTRVPLIAAFVMLAVPAMSYAYLRSFTKRTVINCSIDEFTETNQEVSAVLELSTPMHFSPGAIFFVARTENKMFSEVKRQRFTTNIGHGKSVLRIPFRSELCGITALKIDEVKCYDTLSLFSSVIRFSYEKEIVVYPQKIGLRATFSHEFMLEREGRIHDLYKQGSDPTEILNIRDYVNGDNIKSIHWKLSSKLGRTMVREFSRPNNLDTVIFCDLSLALHNETAPVQAVNNNLALTSALSILLIENGITHSVCVMDLELCDILTVESMDDHADMLREITSLRLSRKDFDSGAAFMQLGISSQFSNIIYVSHNPNQEYIKLMANASKLSVIMTNSEHRDIFESYSNYNIISLSADTLYSEPHTISL